MSPSSILPSPVFLGPVMKASKGKANPVVVDELVRKLITKQN